jgi:hypothetical protein
MGKIVIVDDCLAPARFVYLDYSGPDPFGVSNKVKGMLNRFFSVSTAGISETNFNWSAEGDPIGFYFTWWVQKPFGRSIMRIDIKVQGSKGKIKNVGNFTMELKGEITSRFGYATSFLKPLWWIYTYTFYNRRRRNYVDMCKDYIMGFRAEIAKHYNIKMREG